MNCIRFNFTNKITKIFSFNYLIQILIMDKRQATLQKDEAEARSIDEMRNLSLSNMAKCLLIILQERCRPCLPDANCLCPGTLALQTSELQPYPDTMDCSPAAELHRWPIALTPRRELRNLQQPRYTVTIFLIFIAQNAIKMPQWSVLVMGSVPLGCICQM